MPGHIEQLNRGLFTAKDPAIMPPGALAEAVNARYHVGDPAIWQAEGRQHLGTTLHSSTPLRQVANLQWDPGTQFTDTTAELEQILYHNAEGYYTTRTSEVPTDNPPTPVAAIDRAGAAVAGSAEAARLEAIQIGSQYVLVNGKQPQVVSRAQEAVSGTTRQYIRPLGMPTVGLIEYDIPREQGIPSNMETWQGMVVNAWGLTSTAPFFNRGFHYYWYTWYNSTDKVEGACTAGAAHYAYVPDSVSITTIRLDIPTAVIQNKPEGADYIRVYKTLGLEASRIADGATTPVSVGWPQGFRVLEVAISTIEATTPAWATQSYGGSKWCYRVHTEGYTTSPHNAYVVEQPYYDSGSINVGNDEEIPYNNRGLPPACDTATVFEGSLLTNDKTKRNRVRWSIDDKPDRFPDYSFLDFDTDDYDEVTKVRSYGNICAVYLKNSLWRIEWLPNSRDPLFTRGRVKDLVDGSRGAVWSAAVCDFTPAGGKPMQMFVHTSGIYATDLEVTLPLTNHVDWAAMAPNPASLAGNCWLVNNPDEQRVEFYHGEAVWYLHYDKEHLQEQLPAVTGPCERQGGIFASVPIRTPAGRTLTVTTGYNKRLMYEGFGFTDEAAGSDTLELSVKSRDLYLTQPLNEFRVNDLLVHVKPGSSGGGVWEASLIAGDSTGSRETPAASIKLTERRSIITTAFLLADHVAVHIHGPGAVAAMAVNFFAIGYEDYGESESNNKAGRING